MGLGVVSTLLPGEGCQVGMMQLGRQQPLPPALGRLAHGLIWEASVYGWNQPVDADEKSSEETAQKVPEPKAMPKEPNVPKVPEPKAMPVQPKEPKEVPPPEYRPEPRHPVVVPPPSPSPLTPTPPSCPPPGHVIAQQFAAPSTDGDFEYVQTDAYAEVMHRLGSWSRPT